jgi:hypothetical protein
VTNGKKRGDEGMSRKCWNCRNGIRHKDGTVTCIMLSRLEKKAVDLPKGTVAEKCQAFEEKPKNYKLSKNFKLLW